MKKSIYILLIIAPFLLKAQGSGTMLHFDGFSSYVNAGNINLSGNGLTLVGWVKVDAFKTAHPYITSLFGTEVPGNSAFIRCGDATHPADKLQFILQVGTLQIKLNGSTSLQTNKWYHVAATYDGTAMKLYVNGQLDAQLAQTGSFISNGQFNIGQNYSTDRTLLGSVDEVLVFKTALTQNTIREWMCKKVTNQHPNYSSLEGYFKFDENTGNTTNDASGKGHHGSFVSTPTWQPSEIPLGDESTNDFLPPFNLQQSAQNGDTLIVDSVTGNPHAVYLYRVNQLPQSSTVFPNSIASIDSTGYWGLYFIEGTNPQAKLVYNFQANQMVAGGSSCLINLMERNHNADFSWSNSNALVLGGNFVKKPILRSEIILGFGGSATIYPQSAVAICQGDSVAFQHASSGLNYTWLFNGSVLPNQFMPKIFAKNSGTYQLIYQFQSNCSDTSLPVILNVKPKPVVSFPPINSVCANIPFVFLPQGSPIGGTYHSPYVSGNLFYSSLSKAGTFNVSYQFQDTNGCTNAATQQIKVNALPQVNLLPIGPFCENEPIINLINASVAGGTYYVDGVVQNSINPQNGANTYQVKYELVDSNFCVGKDSILVTVNSLPFVVFSLQDTLICEHFDPILMKGYFPIGGNFSGSGVNGFWFNPLVGTGSHMVTYTYTDSSTNCTNQSIDTITVNARPPKPTITQKGDTLIGSSAYEYEWYDSTNTIVGNQKTLVPIYEGNYLLKTFNIEGCDSELSNTFRFLFDNSGIGILDYTIEQLMKFYPNPSSGEVHFSFLNNSIKQIEIYNGLGQNVFSLILINSNNVTINLNSGVYLVKSVNKNNQISFNKLIIAQ